MNLVDTWLCIIGTLLIGVAATIWWGDGNKTVALWCVAFPGAVMLLMAVGLQIQHREIEKKSKAVAEVGAAGSQQPATNLQKPELRLLCREGMCLILMHQTYGIALPELH